MTTTEPRTAVGRSLIEHMTEDAAGFVTLTSGRFSIGWVLTALANDVPRIEAEARQQALAAFITDFERVLDRHGGHTPGMFCIECGDDRPWKTVVRGIARAVADQLLVVPV